MGLSAKDLIKDDIILKKETLMNVKRSLVGGGRFPFLKY